MLFSKYKRLAGAASAIDARNKLARAIETERTKLLKLIPERFAAETALRDAETALALGEAADLDAAHQRVNETLAAIERQSTILAGLRHRLAGMAGEIESQYRGVKGMLPDHMERIRADFSAEWSKGVAAFSALLGKRKALEALVGRLQLSDPSPVAYELPADVTAPWKAAEELAAALEEIAAFGRAAVLPALDAMSASQHPPYIPGAVYRITHPASGLEPGTLVTDAVFAPGMLPHLSNIGYAVAATSQEWQNTTEAAERAARSISSEAQADRARAASDEQERAYQEQAKNSTPISQQRYEPKDSPERQRERAREAAEVNRQVRETNPEHVGTLTI